MWDLTPEGVRLASDLVRMTGPAVERLIEWEGTSMQHTPEIGEALDAVVMAHYAYCAMTRQTVERVGSVEWVVKALRDSLNRIYRDAHPCGE